MKTIPELESIPGWDSMTARERTLKCCDKLLLNGEAIPGWVTMRQLIGKGSAQDINSAIKESRLIHADEIRRLTGINGIPDSLQALMRQFWLTAVDDAKGTLANQVSEWESRLASMSSALHDAVSEKESAQVLLSKADSEIQANRTVIAALHSQIEVESATRIAAESATRTAQDALRQQSEAFSEALRQARSDVDAAITRLEGVEAHGLREIDRARTDAERRIASMESRLSTSTQDHKLERARLEQQLATARAENLELQAKVEALEMAGRERKPDTERLKGRFRRSIQKNGRVSAADER